MSSKPQSPHLSWPFLLAPPVLRKVNSQPAWMIRSDQVELAVTRLGAQIAPVSFYRNDPEPVKPYHISPWQGEDLDLAFCPVLTPLRGDFFCLPFGGNGTAFQGEQHPPHGETAGSPWSLLHQEREAGVTTLKIGIETTVRKGCVTEEISLVNGENVIYTKTVIEGFEGKTTLAHHAILAMPEKEGAVQISTSPIQFGMTCPYLFSDPKQGEYQSLAIGAIFEDLTRVPVIFKDQPDTDCSSYPARYGYADLLQVFDKPPGSGTPSWVAAVNAETNSIWFALKDSSIMLGRVFWTENHGRYGKPWNGRNNCLGIEDGCMFFDKGIAESVAPNIISNMDVPTSVELVKGKQFIVNYIQGVVKVPARFKKVAAVEFKKNAVEFISSEGDRVTAKVRHSFIFDGKVKECTAFDAMH